MSFWCLINRMSTDSTVKSNMRLIDVSTSSLRAKWRWLTTYANRHRGHHHLQTLLVFSTSNGFREASSVWLAVVLTGSSVYRMLTLVCACQWYQCVYEQSENGRNVWQWQHLPCRLFAITLSINESQSKHCCGPCYWTSHSSNIGAFFGQSIWFVCLYSTPTKRWWLPHGYFHPLSVESTRRSKHTTHN